MEKAVCRKAGKKNTVAFVQSGKTGNWKTIKQFKMLYQTNWEWLNGYECRTKKIIYLSFSFVGLLRYCLIEAFKRHTNYGSTVSGILRNRLSTHKYRIEKKKCKNGKATKKKEFLGSVIEIESKNAVQTIIHQSKRWISLTTFRF